MRDLDFENKMYKIAIDILARELEVRTNDSRENWKNGACTEAFLQVCNGIK